jgi:hypothetical protein
VAASSDPPAASAPAPAAAASSSPPDPSSTASGYQTPAVGNIQNVGQGTVIPFSDTDASATGDSSQPQATEAADSSNSGNGFTADGLLGGAAGK